MAGYRQIHPKIWKDEWFIELDPEEKLFFIYLFSNDETTFTGLYKLPIRVMINETGMPKERIIEMLDKFEKEKKVFYRDGVVWVVNMRKHHPSDSPKVNARIKYDMLSIPDCELKTRCLQSLNIISIPYQKPIDTESLKDEDVDEEEDKNTPAFQGNPLSIAFSEASGISAYDLPKWIQSIERIEKKEATPDDVKITVSQLREKNYTILGPWSIENAIINTIGKRRSNGRSAISLEAQGFRGPE